MFRRPLLWGVWYSGATLIFAGLAVTTVLGFLPLPIDGQSWLPLRLPLAVNRMMIEWSLLFCLLSGAAVSTVGFSVMWLAELGLKNLPNPANQKSTHC